MCGHHALDGTRSAYLWPVYRESRYFQVASYLQISPRRLMRIACSRPRWTFTSPCKPQLIGYFQGILLCHQEVSSHPISLLLCSFGVILWEICTAEAPTRGRMNPVRWVAALIIGSLSQAQGYSKMEAAMQDRNPRKLQFKQQAIPCQWLMLKKRDPLRELHTFVQCSGWVPWRCCRPHWAVHGGRPKEEAKCLGNYHEDSSHTNHIKTSPSATLVC